MGVPEAIRLQLRLARAGIASRRHCEKIIAEGRVSVNGKVLTKPGLKVTPDDIVRIDGNLVDNEKRKIYIALHKPRGYLCSDFDPEGRPLAKNLIDVAVRERFFHVGRLDYMSSGLIFFSNDGEFSRVLTHPSSRVEKEYIVTTKAVIPDDLVLRFSRGITINGIRYSAERAEQVGPRTARIVLIEGKNRELRRVFSSASLSIKRVHRIRIGLVRIAGIPSGHFRHLKAREIRILMKHTGMRVKPLDGENYGGGD